MQSLFGNIKATRWMGTSIDTKPTDNIWIGSEFYETDTGVLYIYSGTEWVVKSEVNLARGYVWNASTLAWEAASQSTVTVGALTVTGVAVSNWPDLITEKYDEIALGYSGTQLSTVTYKLSGVTVATLTLSYSGTTLTGVTKT